MLKGKKMCDNRRIPKDSPSLVLDVGSPWFGQRDLKNFQNWHLYIAGKSNSQNILNSPTDSHGNCKLGYIRGFIS